MANTRDDEAISLSVTTATRLSAAILGLLLVSGCSGGDSHNDADVEFATVMVDHHAQAIAMADLTLGRAGLDPRISRLADNIRETQSDEIDSMSGWLESWGEPVPETGFATGDGHAHGGDLPGTGMDTSMPGMMSDAEMSALADAPPTSFGDQWVEMMVAHHRGALAMAEAVVRDGSDPEVRRLAENVAEDQQAEIDRMLSW